MYLPATIQAHDNIKNSIIFVSLDTNKSASLFYLGLILQSIIY